MKQNNKRRWGEIGGFLALVFAVTMQSCAAPSGAAAGGAGFLISNFLLPFLVLLILVVVLKKGWFGIKIKANVKTILVPVVVGVLVIIVLRLLLGSFSMLIMRHLGGEAWLALYGLPSAVVAVIAAVFGPLTGALLYFVSSFIGMISHPSIKGLIGCFIYSVYGASIGALWKYLGIGTSALSLKKILVFNLVQVAASIFTMALYRILYNSSGFFADTIIAGCVLGTAGLYLYSKIAEARRAEAAEGETLQSAEGFITCTACSKEYYKDAASCPQCGKANPILEKKHKKMMKIRIIAAIVGLVLTVAFIVFAMTPAFDELMYEWHMGR